MMPALTFLTPAQPPSTETISTRLLLPCRLERLIGPGCGRLVDRVDDVDVGRPLQAVFHRGLPLGLIALRVLAAHDAGIAVLDAETLQEAVVAQLADGDPGREIERGDPGRLAGHRGPGILADQHAGLEIVGGEQRVGCALRIGRRIERDHEHAGIARLLDGRDDRLRVARGDENRPGAAAHHVLDGGDLAGIVAVELAGRGHQLGAFGFRRLHGAFLHLHEERVGIRLRDEADHDFLSMGEGCRARSDAQHDASATDFMSVLPGRLKHTRI